MGDSTQKGVELNFLSGERYNKKIVAIFAVA